MIIKDIVYGKCKVDEEVLIELIKSPTVQRTKFISQFGVPDKYYHKKNFSRFEHTIGVMLLLKRLGATLEEQVAGLLHDVSHFPFSHVMDWVLAESAENSESLHDKLHHEFLVKTDIPKILEKYGFSFNRITNEENFLLLERESPNLCADRVDYSLREMAYNEDIIAIKRILCSIANFNGKLICLDKKTANLFARKFLMLQKTHWGGKQAVLGYHIFSYVIKYCLEKKL